MRHSNGIEEEKCDDEIELIHEPSIYSLERYDDFVEGILLRLIMELYDRSIIKHISNDYGVFLNIVSLHDTLTLGFSSYEKVSLV